MPKIFLSAGAFFGATAVMLGAFGAHGLQGRIDEENIRIFHTGVEYQFYHALVLLLTGVLSQLFKVRNTFAGYLFIAGIILFSGSLYLLSTISLTGFQRITWFGVATPVGGLCLIAGWILLLISFLRIKNMAE